MVIHITHYVWLGVWPLLWIFRLRHPIKHFSPTQKSFFAPKKKLISAPNFFSKPRKTLMPVFHKCFSWAAEKEMRLPKRVFGRQNGRPLIWCQFVLFRCCYLRCTSRCEFLSFQDHIGTNILSALCVSIIDSFSNGNFVFFLLFIGMR